MYTQKTYAHNYVICGHQGELLLNHVADAAARVTPVYSTAVDTLLAQCAP